MTPKSNLGPGLAKVRRARLEGRNDLALAEVDRLLRDCPDQPQLLVLRAELIQLQEDEDGVPSLEEAKRDLLKAISLDETSPNALIELGHFLYAIEDNADEASKYLRKAIALCRNYLEDALLGQAEVLLERERDSEAFACLAEAYGLRRHDGRPNDKVIFERLRSLLQTG